MTLVEIYKTEPERLLNSVYNDFEDGQWQDLAVYLGSHQKNPYNSAVLQRILPIIGNRVLWLSTTSAQQFLYTAVFENDANMARFVLDNFENVRSGDGCIEEWISYIETALEMLHDIEINDRDYSVLNVLFEYFKDDGCGVLFCVRREDRDLFDRLLPHTDVPSANTVTAYCWAKVYDLNEFQKILEPIACKIESLYELEFTYDWNCEKTDIVAQTAKDLYENIVEGSYDSDPRVQLFKQCLNDQCDWKSLRFTCSPLCLQKMVLLLSKRHPANASVVLSYIDVFHDEMAALFVAQFKDRPDLIVPRLSPISRQKELCACARRSDAELAQQLVCWGADLDHALEELSAQKGWHNSNNPFIQSIVQSQYNAAGVVQHWINERQAQLIANELHLRDGTLLSRKI